VKNRLTFITFFAKLPTAVTSLDQHYAEELGEITAWRLFLSIALCLLYLITTLYDFNKLWKVTKCTELSRDISMLDVKP
jgi:hypothetical protein